MQNREEDIFKIFWINPDLVSLLSGGEFNKRADIGKVIDGEWDRRCDDFINSIQFKGIYDRFTKGLEWKETNYYKHGMERLGFGDTPWMCKNKEEFEHRLKNLDKLFAHIKENGFTANPEKMFNVYSYKVKVLNEVNKAYGFMDHITVDIGRDGKPLLADGAHRLAIAKILDDVDKVPVIVRVRHRQWVKFKNELKTYAETEPGEKLYQKAYHFDLESIPYFYDEGRINLIKQSTDLAAGSMLDIGAFFGLNCHELEKEGFDCTAVESNILRAHFAKKLRDANKDKFEVVNQSIFDFKKGEKLEFDIIIALYIFHHFLKTEIDYKKLKDFLSRLDCKEMFLGVHNPKEFKNKFGDDVYKNYGPDEFSDFIIKNSCLEKKELLKEFNNGRRIYKLSR